MKNSRTLIPIGLILLLTLAGFIGSLLGTGKGLSFIIEITSGIGGIIGQIMLIKHGSLRKTIYWRIMMLLIALLFMAALIKIQHWPYGNLLFSGALLSIPITYLFHFLKKNRKTRLDILKLIYILATYAGTSLYAMKFLPKQFLSINFILFWMTMFEFGMQEWRKQQAPAINPVNSDPANGDK